MDLASHFQIAPEVAGDGKRLVDVKVNGYDSGAQVIRIADGTVILPPETVRALGIKTASGAALDLAQTPDITIQLDKAQATLVLSVPASRLVSQRFAPGSDGAALKLSPETWGAFADYDFNMRHVFGASGDSGGLGSASSRSSPLAAGGVLDLHVLAPGAKGSFGWAYDSTRPLSEAVIRLDSTANWRPAGLDFSVSAGDVISAAPGSFGEARTYRFGGVQIGTDHSGTPGWSNSPIASVTGTAQVQSNIDVYLDGQRTFHTSTAGGIFSLVLPPGSTGLGTNVVVTDVTGKSVVIPVEVPQADAQLLRQGSFLWSAGVGAPRFNYGAAQTSYDGQVYGYASARYGLVNAVTTAGHVEGGPGLMEAELTGDMSVTPWLAVHGLIAGSRSGRGVGGAGRAGFIIALPADLTLEARAGQTFGSFDDIVSVTGRSYGRGALADPLLSLPATSDISARLSWQPAPRLSLAASYEAERYKGSGTVGFASVSANYLVAGRLPVFASLSRAMGGQRETSLVVGVSFTLGEVQASTSAGVGFGAGRGSTGDRGATGAVTASKPLGETIGDYGWNAYATHAPTGTFADADAQIRTGYGIPGIAVQSFGNAVTGIATMRGSAGVVGLHPFISDPAHGGLIIADADKPGVAVQLNGYDKGQTSFDGKLAVTGAVSGVPQRVTIDTARLPLDSVPAETDGLVTIRDGGAAIVALKVHAASSSATITVSVQGQPPPVGSTLRSSTSSAPMSKEGRAYLPYLDRNEILVVEMPDGTRCRVDSHFDGSGGVSRRLGPLPCE